MRERGRKIPLIEAARQKQKTSSSIYSFIFWLVTNESQGLPKICLQRRRAPLAATKVEAALSYVPSITMCQNTYVHIFFNRGFRWRTLECVTFIPSRDHGWEGNATSKRTCTSDAVCGIKGSSSPWFSRGRELWATDKKISTFHAWIIMTDCSQSYHDAAKKKCHKNNNPGATCERACVYVSVNKEHFPLGSLHIRRKITATKMSQPVRSFVRTRTWKENKVAYMNSKWSENRVCRSLL